jgi:hypothetical protein
MISKPPGPPSGRRFLSRRPVPAGFVLLAGALLGCTGSPPSAPSPEQPAPPWFRDVTDEVGLRFTHDAGPLGQYPLPQIMGSGAALFDYDNDGRLDIYLVNNGGPTGPPNRLFHQDPDGRFTDVTTGSGLGVAGWGMGVAVGDVNNDGWPDVLLTEYGAIRLFLNQGNGTFRDVTKEAGLENSLWGTSASFLDYDRDGWLDLVVVNYVYHDPSRFCGYTSGKRDYCNPKVFPSAVTKLFRNLGVARAAGEGVRFRDVTLDSGLGRLPGPGLGVVCADFDGDGWPDILVANDEEPNRLWINRRDGTFVDEAVARGIGFNSLGQYQGNMGIALGDVDGDGLFDIYVTHLAEETNTLWMQRPRGSFQDRTAAAGLAASRWRGTGFGAVLADFDHDGAPDLAVVNGRVLRVKLVPVDPRVEATLGPHWSQYAERNQLFANDGTGRFRDISEENSALCGVPGVYRGLCYGDVDGDGALDLLVTETAGRARLYKNVAPRRGHWLLVRALDPALRRDAYGAQVTVHAGGKRWRCWINPASSYLCSNDPRGHVGLGAVDRFERIEVLWPDGKEESFPGGAADRVVVIRKGEGKTGE